MNSHPFDEVLKNADATIERGGTVYQQFTCGKCGAKLSMDIPNTFYTSGTCDQCGTITDLKANGCNFMAVMSGQSFAAILAGGVNGANDSEATQPKKPGDGDGV